MKILSVYNIKGGVGKTAAAVNLAYLAAREGARTLIWDLDPQGAASFYFRIKPKVKGGSKSLLNHKRSIDEVIKSTDFADLDLLPADFSYRNLDLALADTKKPIKQLFKLLHPMGKEYDVLFLDCPPSISMVSENIFYASDALLIPTIPTTLSLRTYDQLQHHLKKVRLTGAEFMPFFSMVDRRKRLHRDTVDELQTRDSRVLETTIPYASQVELMGEHREPIFSYAPRSTPAAAYETLWEEIKNRVWKQR
ncbi:MAG: AAA family ATPase [Gammaproteobacteria bacterium]|nr:AAA family ATPase [Gammaproteobacteria bacterium]